MEYSTTNPTLPYSAYSKKPAGRNEIRTVISLPVSGWEDNLQSVTVTDATSTNLIIVSPTPESFLDYSSAVVRCISQSNNILGFKCNSVPASDLMVNVVIRK